MLRCSGDEDRASQSLRRRALSRALTSGEDVRVDLSDLEFADATLMVDLAMVAGRLRHVGGRMVVCGAAPHIHTLIQHVGLHRLPSVSVEGAGPSPA